MSVLVLLKKPPIPVHDLALRLTSDLNVPVRGHDVFPFGYLEAEVAEDRLFDAAEPYLPFEYYTTGSYPDE